VKNSLCEILSKVAAFLLSSYLDWVIVVVVVVLVVGYYHY
jgi:hypothetical protein